MADHFVERNRLQARLLELNDELADIDEKRAAIKGQIDQAVASRRVTGEYADADWFRRAKGADRHLGVERNDVCREIGETDRALRRLNGLLNRNTLVVAVREVVDEATWERIVARHQELIEDSHG